MKKHLLKLILLNCLLFLGFTSAHAVITYTVLAPGANGLATSPISVSSTQTAVPVYGISIKNSNAAGAYTGIRFDLASGNNWSTLITGNISLYVMTATQYTGAGNAFSLTASTLLQTQASPATANLTFNAFTGTNPAFTAGATLYYFVVINYTNGVVAVPTTDQIEINRLSVGGTNTNVTETGGSYTYNSAISVSAGSTAGYTNPLAVSAAGVPLIGITVTNASSTAFTFGQFDLTSSIAPSTYFANFKLFVNTTGNTFAGATTQVTATFNGTTGTTDLNPTFTATIPANTSYTYFIVADYTYPAPTTATTFQLSVTDLQPASGNPSYTTGAFAGPVLNIPAVVYDTYSVAPLGVTAGPTNGLVSNPIINTQTNIAVYGLQVTGAGANTTTAQTISALQFTESAASTYQNLSSYFANFRLYSSTTPTFGGTGAGTSTLLSTVAAPATATISFTGLTQSVAYNSVLYYFVVVDYNTFVAASSTFELDFTKATANGTNVTTAATGFNYSLPILTITATSLNTATNPTQPTAGLTPNPVSATATGLPVYGLQLSASAAGATKTITALNFTQAGGQNNNYYMANAYLYSSTSPTYSVGTGTLLKTITGVGATTTLNFTGLTISVAAGQTLYYFVLIDYNTPVTAAANFILDFTSATGATITGTPAGYTYNFSALTITATALGVTGGPTNGLTASPIATTATSLPIYGMQLTATTPGPTRTITTLNFTSNSPQGGNNYYFSKEYLYSSTSSTFPGVGNPGATLVSTVTTDATDNISFTGLNIPVAAGATLYYFVVVDYTTFIAAGTATYQLNFTSAVGATIAAGAGNTGFNYTITSPTYTIATNTTGIQTAATPYYLGSTGDVLESFGVTSTNTGTLNSFTLTSTTAYTTYFSNLKIYASTNPNYAADLAGTGSALLPVAWSTAGTTTVVVTLTGGQAISSTPLYFFVLADFTGDAAAFTSTATSINFQFSMSAASVTPTSGTVTATNTYPIAYTTYKLQCPTALGAATTTGLAAAGSLNSTTQTQQGILGFAVTSTQNETISSMTLTPTVSVGNMSNYFSNVTLYVSATNNFAAATAVPAGYTVSSLAGTTFTISGLTQAVNTTTLYYFIKADYTPPTSGNPTFQLSATNVTTSAPATFTYTCGAPINGTVYTLYNGVTTLAALGVAGGPTNGLMANPVVNIQSGAVYGFSLANSGTDNSPTITALTFTSVDPQNNNQYYFDSFMLYSSPTSTFSAATATQVGTTITTGANNNPISFTGLNITIPASGTLYYFVVGAYNGVPAASTYQMNFTSATTALSTTSVAAGATNTGFNYTCNPLTYTITTNTTGIQTAATPYYFGSTGDVLESFEVTSTGNSTFTSFTLKPYIAGNNSNATPYTTYFGNFTVYTSTNPNYAADLAGTGSPLTAVAVTTTGTGTLLVTLNTAQAISPTPLYYFVVADFTAGDNLFTNTTTATTFQFRLTTATGSATLTNAAVIAYTTYNLLSPVALSAATTTGLATANQLSYNQTQVGILGFAVTTVQNETITSMNFSAAISSFNSTIGTFFSNVNLYVSTTNNFAAATLVTGATVSSLTSTSLTFNISGLSQVINNTTLYYFIKADYSAPTNFQSTFQLSVTNVINSSPTTFVCGAPINGITYTCSPAVLLASATTAGLASNPITTSATGIGIFGFSVFSGPGYTFTTFNLYSTQPAGQYLNTNFANYKLYVNTTNSFTGATQVTTATFSAIANSNTLTISGLTQAIPAGTTYYYFIEADYTAPAVATTYELNLTSVATSTNTYTTGGPIYGTNYTLTGPLGVYYFIGIRNNTATWETAGSWLNAYTGTSSGYPGQSLNNDIAVFSPTYQKGYIANITASKTIGQILVIANNTNPFIAEINNGLTCTITNGVTLGDAGQLSNNGTDYSQLGLYETNNNGTGIFYIGGTSSLYNDGSLAASAKVVFNSGSIVNMYGTTADPAFLGTFTGAAVTGSNVTFNCTGAAGEIYGSAGTFAATSSTLNFSGFGAQMYADGATMTLTGCTVNATGTSNTNAITGLGVSAGSLTATTSTVINLGTSSSNGAFTDVNLNGGTFTLSGSSTINLIGQSSNIANDYYIPGATSTINITGSTVNMGSTSGSDGISSEIYNSSVFNLNAVSLINMNGANSEILNTSTTYGGATYPGIFIANATSVINPTSTTAVIYNNMASNYFTLLSTSAASATIGTMGAGATMVGQYNVQRYLNGGATYLRNYRMLSSPVNMSGYVSNSSNLIDLSYIGATATVPTTPATTYYGAFIGGPDPSFGGGIHTFVNPLMYLYQESITPGSAYNAAFTSGKNVGVASLNAAANTIGTKSSAAGAGSMSPASAAPSVPSTATALPSYDNATGVAVPPGNGYITYYVGNSQDLTPSSQIAPTASTVTASGYINQGQVQLYLWGSVSPYLTNTYGIPNVRLPGITVVGNPYPSTIDLNQVWYDNANAISTSLYQLDNTTQQFDTYNASTHLSSTSVSAEYIGSGLGFYVHTDSLGTTKQFYFQEDQKTPSTTSGFYPPLSNFSVRTPFQTADNVNTAKLIDAVNPTSTTDAVTQPGTPGKVIAMGGQITARVQPPVPRSNVKPEAPQPPHKAITNLVKNPAYLHLKFVVDSVDNDEVALAFNKAWTDKYDSNDSFDLDGQSGKVYLSSYSSDHIRTSVNALGDYTGGKRVKLFVKATTTGIYQLQMSDIANFDTADYSVFLLDNLRKDSLDLTLYKSYNLNYTPGTANDSTRFVLAIEHKPVPYFALLTFTGQKVTPGVELNWQTKNQGNKTTFVLQKLNASNVYVAIDSLQSDSSGEFSYIDQHPVLGNNTYRLQETNELGKITYSAPVTIGYNSTAPNGGLTIYPNPSRDIITVTLSTSSIATTVATADIYNMSGTLIEHLAVSSNSFTHNISSYQLGVYIIELKNSNGVLVGKSKFVKVQ